MAGAGEEKEASKDTKASPRPPAQVAVIGCGWWAQGWHLPHLAANAPHVEIAAIVDPTPTPISTLSSSPLLSLPKLSEKYNCPYFTSVSELLGSDVGPTLDGAVVATSHASHFSVGMALLNEGMRRRQMANEGGEHRAVNILMEKPLATEVDEARKLWEASAKEYPDGAFVINHTASYRPQTQVARHIVATNQLGKVRHIQASMNGPLMWLFDDARNHSWVSKTPWKGGAASSAAEEDGSKEKRAMSGNGYAWGQLAHILAWIYSVLGAGDSAAADDNIAIPTKVYCTMSHSSATGADISLAAVISCHDGVTFSLTGTALLPGSQYADPPVGKHINVEIFGEKGSLMYGGDDRIPESGKLELRRTAVGKKEDGQSEFPCSNQDWSDVLGDEASGLKDGFYFEDGEVDGTGPGSMRAFLDACQGLTSGKPANDSLIGLRTVQIIDAMYRSSISGNAEDIKS